MTAGPSRPLSPALWAAPCGLRGTLIPPSLPAGRPLCDGEESPSGRHRCESPAGPSPLSRAPHECDLPPGAQGGEPLPPRPACSARSDRPVPAREGCHVTERSLLCRAPVAPDVCCLVAVAMVTEEASLH